MTVEEDHVRMLEAILFASDKPLTQADLTERLPDGVDVAALLSELSERYALRGINLVKRGTLWSFQTAPDLAFLLRREVEEPKRLSRAAVETLAIVAYHQPVSRAEIEDIRGVSLSKGTLDLLMEAGWVRPVGRREVPGRPVIYGTTTAFLAHFGLESLKDLPGLEELKATGMLEPMDSRMSLILNEDGDEEEILEEPSLFGDEPIDLNAPDEASEPDNKDE